MSKTSDDLDSDDSEDSMNQSNEQKERHSSGESNDSAISITPPSYNGNEPLSPSKRFLVIPANLSSTAETSNVKGILKRGARCLSESQAEYLSSIMTSMSMDSTITEESEAESKSSVESKKSVRFNEVVQRQVYRQNSSILGQKMKNMKKAEQKRRKAEQKRRASEGDSPAEGSSSLGKSPSSYQRYFFNIIVF